MFQFNPFTGTLDLNTGPSSYADDVLEFENLAQFPIPGEQGKIYVSRDDNRAYRWPEGGTDHASYREISALETHTHAIADTTGLQTALDGKASTTALSTETTALSQRIDLLVENLGTEALDSVSEVAARLEALQSSTGNPELGLGSFESVERAVSLFDPANEQTALSVFDQAVVVPTDWKPRFRDAIGAHAAGSYATLDGGGKVPASQLPSFTPADIGAASNFHEHLRQDITNLPESFQNRAPLYSRIVISGASPSFLNGPLDLFGLSSVNDYSRPNYEGERSSGERVQIIYEDDVFQIRSIFNGVTTWHANSAEVERWSPIGLNWNVWDTPSPEAFPVTISGKFAFFVPAPAANDNTKFLKGDGTWAIADGLPVIGTENTYVFVLPGDDLEAAYAGAKTARLGWPFTDNNNLRYTIFILPGEYNLASELAVNGEKIDLVGLGAQTQRPAVLITGNTLNVTANDVRVSGISTNPQQFNIGDNKPLQVFENCTGGNNSFGYSGTASGTFTNCTGGNASFGSGGTASGTFTNCAGRIESFGGGSGGALTGKLFYCRLTSGSFPTPSGAGIIRLCLDGSNNIVNAG